MTMPILADAHDCRSCDTCASQEGHHYCLLHTVQIKNMDTVRCSDWTERANEMNEMTSERIAELRGVPPNNSIRATLMHECLDEIKALQAEVEKIKAAFAPTIEALESAERRLKDVEQWDHDGYGEPYNSIVKELARLRAVVDGGK